MVAGKTKKGTGRAPTKTFKKKFPAASKPFSPPSGKGIDIQKKRGPVI
ncbi:hypothetical protein LCGC14_1763130, partial [marine sediment metagenome]